MDCSCVVDGCICEAGGFCGRSAAAANVAAVNTQSSKLTNKKLRILCLSSLKPVKLYFKNVRLGHPLAGLYSKIGSQCSSHSRFANILETPSKNSLDKSSRRGV